MQERGRAYARLNLSRKPNDEAGFLPSFCLSAQIVIQVSPCLLSAANFGTSISKKALESASMSSTVAFPQTLADQSYLHKYSHNISSLLYKSLLTTHSHARFQGCPLWSTESPETATLVPQTPGSYGKCLGPIPSSRMTCQFLFSIVAVVSGSQCNKQLKKQTFYIPTTSLESRYCMQSVKINGERPERKLVRTR